MNIDGVTIAIIFVLATSIWLLRWAQRRVADSLNVDLGEWIDDTTITIPDENDTTLYHLRKPIKDKNTP